MAITAQVVRSADQLAWANRTVLMVDVVESVRLVEQDEVGTISRWLAFVEHVKTNLLVKGRLIKTLGDGMLLGFDDVASAVIAALRIIDTADRENAAYTPDLQILLRMGLEVGDVIVENDDVHGRGVNIAARLTTLAGPGEIVVSQRVRDRLTSTVDADIEDLGECFLRHVKEPVRAYRIGHPRRAPAVRSFVSSEDLRPTIAVIPFNSHRVLDEDLILGEVFAEQLIGALSCSHEMNVISRLSTTVFRGREASLSEVASQLQADYVLSGVYRSAEPRVAVSAELAAKSGRVLWTESFEEDVSAVLSKEQELIGGLAAKICAAVRAREVQRTRLEPLPTLEAYALLIGAVTLMHRLTRRDFEEAHRLLLALLDRRSREPITLAWLASWHNLRVQQGWSADPGQDARIALSYTKRALEVDPDCSQALVVSGLVHTMLFKQLDIANECYEQALAVNPSNPLAWLQKGTLHAFMSEGRKAVEHVERALKLSPLDPHRYLYDSLAATAYIADQQFDRALEFAQRSLRANRQHTSTLRAMIVAQWRLGSCDEARKTALELLRLEPSFTVSNWLERTPAAKHPIGRDAAEALQLAGVPN